MRKIQIFIGVSGLVIGLGAWLFPMQNHSIQIPVISDVFASRIPKLKVCGVGATVNIKRGDIPYRGGIIDSINALANIYIADNQHVEVNVTGAGVTLNIDSSIADQVVVNSSGVGTRVNEI